MKFFLIISFLFFCHVSWTQSFSISNNFKITEHFSCEQYANMKTIQKHLEKVNVYDLSYYSFDKIRVKGFLITPNGESKKYPVVIFNRGGNGDFGMVTEPYIVRFLSRIASNGFIVIGSQLRGSEGSEGTDEFGGGEIDDVLSLFNILDNIKTADTSNIVQLGWSRGGITNFQLLKRTKRIKSTITIAGPSNILKTHRKEMFDVYKNRIPNYERDSIFYANKVSPLFQIDSILNKKESFLFIHGDQDERVELSNSIELYKRTQELGYNSNFIVFNNGDHSLFNQLEKLIYDITFWLNSIIN